MVRTYRLIPAIVALMFVPLLGAHAQRTARTGGGADTKSDAPAVALVNGQKIPYSRFQALYNDQISYMKKLGELPVVDQATEDALMMQLIDAELFRQEASRHKVLVTRDEAVKMLLKDPPDFIRPPFTDQRGVFQKEIFRKVVLNPNLITSLVSTTQNPDTVRARWKEDLEEVVNFIIVTETKRKLGDALIATKPLTAKMIHDHYFAEKTKFNGSFIRVLHNTIPDSTVPVTEAETRAWYDSHIEDYRFPSSRYLATLVIPVYPIGVDSARHKEQMNEARSMIMKAAPADRPKVVSMLLNSLPPNRFPTDAPVSLTQIPESVRESVRNGKAGDLIGPVQGEHGEETFFFIDGITRGTDTAARVRHILVKPDKEAEVTDSIAYNFLAMIRDSIRTEEMFKELAERYGQDGTAQKQGDLGYFMRGKMVREFDSVAFSAPVGKAIGPVKTRFGYHLLWVSERTSTAYNIRELRFRLLPSDAARERVTQDAEAYAAALRAGDVHAADSLYTYMKQRYPRSLTDTALLKRLDIYGDALTTATVAFAGKVGDVGVIQAPYDRVIVAKILQEWPSGVAPYDKIRQNYVIPHVKRYKQLEMLKPTMARLRDTMTPDMTLGIIRITAPWAEAFMLQNQPLSPPLDEEPTILDSLVAITPNKGISGPVRGKHAYYFLRVIDRTSAPTESDFQRDRAAYTQDYTERYRQKLLDEVIARARQYADVQDNRGRSKTVKLGKME